MLEILKLVKTVGFNFLRHCIREIDANITKQS